MSLLSLNDIFSHTELTAVGLNYTICLDIFQVSIGLLLILGIAFLLGLMTYHLARRRQKRRIEQGLKEILSKRPTYP